MTYDPAWGTIVVQWMFAKDVYIHDGSIAWEEIAALYEPLLAILLGIVGGLLFPIQRSHGLVVGWGQVIEDMVTDGTHYAWGT